MRGMDFIIKSRADLIEAINKYGFLPYFRNSIEGFSIEKHIEPRYWFGDEEGAWEWEGSVIQKTYGKFFECNVVYISKEWFPDFANYRRDGYDFDALYDDGLARHTDKVLYDLLDKSAPIISKELKKLGNYRKGGNKGFDTSITRLQEQCYVIISNFVYMTERWKCGRMALFCFSKFDFVLINFLTNIEQRSQLTGYQICFIIIIRNQIT